jgi:GNAT superfamily N-acetyltransferase
VVSSGSSEDADAVAELLRLAYPYAPFTSAGIRHRFEVAHSEERPAWWKVEREGRLVGWAHAALNVLSAERGRAFAILAVHPQARGSGVGSMLWSTVASHLSEIAATKTTIVSRDDAASMRFARGRGLAQVATDTMLAVDLRTLESAVVPPDVVVQPLSAFSEDPELVFSCDAEAARDEPGPFDLDGMTMERWLRLFWEHPELERDLSVALVAGDDVVGTTFLFADRAHALAENGGTGVRREHRGRGYGLLMKRASHARAAAAGITQIVTHNDETNAPMFAINRRLGYEQVAVGHCWQLEA